MYVALLAGRQVVTLILYFHILALQQCTQSGTKRLPAIKVGPNWEQWNLRIRWDSCIIQKRAVRGVPIGGGWGFSGDPLKPPVLTSPVVPVIVFGLGTVSPGMPRNRLASVIVTVDGSVIGAFT